MKDTVLDARGLNFQNLLSEILANDTMVDFYLTV